MYKRLTEDGLAFPFGYNCSQFSWVVHSKEVVFYADHLHLYVFVVLDVEVSKRFIFHIVQLTKSDSKKKAR